MADWTSLLPQAAPQTNVGGLLDLANKAYELQAAPARVQQQYNSANQGTMDTGINYLKNTAQVVAGYATKERPSDDEMGNLFLALSKQYLPEGSPRNPQAVDAIARLHREYDALPKGENEKAWKARRQWAGEVGARYGGSAGNMPTQPVYDEKTGSIKYVPPNVVQRDIAPGGGGAPGTGPTGGPAPGTTSGASVPTPGKPPVPARITNDDLKPVLAVPPQGAGNLPGTVQSAASPIQTADMTAIQKSKDETGKYKSETLPQLQALRAVRGLEQVGGTLGPGVDEKTRLHEAVRVLMPEVYKKLKTDPDEAHWVNEFNKWSANIAAAAPGGEGSVARFLNAQSGTVHSTMDPGTVKDMLATTIGLSNMAYVAKRQAQLAGPNNFTANYQANINSLDHRAFGLNHLDPEAQRRVIAGVMRESPEAQKRFLVSRKLAEKYEKEEGLYNRMPMP